MVVHSPASRTDFHPPLGVRGFPDTRIGTLDEAERFVHEHPELKGHDWEGLLRTLQVAKTEWEREDAANSFRAWLEAEQLLLLS